MSRYRVKAFSSTQAAFESTEQEGLQANHLSMMYLWASSRVLVAFVLSILLYTVFLFLCRVFVIKVCAGLDLLFLFCFFSSLFEEVCRHAMQICSPSAIMGNNREWVQHSFPDTKA